MLLLFRKSFSGRLFFLNTYSLYIVAKVATDPTSSLRWLLPKLLSFESSHLLLARAGLSSHPTSSTISASPKTRWRNRQASSSITYAVSKILLPSLLLVDGRPSNSTWKNGFQAQRIRSCCK